MVWYRHYLRWGKFKAWAYDNHPTPLTPLMQLITTLTWVLGCRRSWWWRRWSPCSPRWPPSACTGSRSTARHCKRVVMMMIIIVRQWWWQRWPGDISIVRPGEANGGWLDIGNPHIGWGLRQGWNVVRVIFILYHELLQNFSSLLVEGWIMYYDDGNYKDGDVGVK